jgi:ubiquinone/menaquinone biosynthesis C-methylase UbiE
MGNKLRKILMDISRSMRDVIAPEAIWTEYRYENTVKKYMKDSKWLDLGCGNQPFPEKSTYDTISGFTDLARSVVGLDPDLKSIIEKKVIKYKICGIGENLPFKNGAFSFITANMVLGHIEKPQKLFREISRVLEPDGIFLVHTSNMYGYDTLIARLITYKFRRKIASFLFNISQEDVYATYYRANSYKQIENLSKFSNLNCKEIKLFCSSPVTAVMPSLAFFELILL